MKATLVLAFLCLTTMASLIQAGGQGKDGDWRILQTHGSGPGVRDAVSAIPFNDDVYIFGGINESLDPTNLFPNTFYNDIYKFNTNSKTWTRLNANPDPVHGFPIPRAFSVSGRNGNNLIICFGINYTSDFSSINTFNDVWAYNVYTNRWRMLRPNNDPTGPSPRGEPTGAVYNGKIFLFGGVTNFFSSLDDFWIYDISTDEWTQHTPATLPSARHGTDYTLDASHGRLWMYAGERAEFNDDGLAFVFAGPDAFWYLDLDSYQWVRVNADAPGIPNRSSGNGAAWISGKFFLFGGDIQGGNPCENFITLQNNVNETWAYRSDKNDWNRICTKTIPPNLKRAKMAVVGDTIYMFGGFAFDSRVCSPIVFNTDVWAYTPKGGKGGPKCKTNQGGNGGGHGGNHDDDDDDDDD